MDVFCVVTHFVHTVFLSHSSRVPGLNLSLGYCVWSCIAWVSLRFSGCLPSGSWIGYAQLTIGVNAGAWCSAVERHLRCSPTSFQVFPEDSRATVNITRMKHLLKINECFALAINSL